MFINVYIYIQLINLKVGLVFPTNDNSCLDSYKSCLIFLNESISMTVWLKSIYKFMLILKFIMISITHIFINVSKFIDYNEIFENLRENIHSITYVSSINLKK